MIEVQSIYDVLQSKNNIRTTILVYIQLQWVDLHNQSVSRF